MGYVKQRGDGWRAFVQRGKYRPTKTFSTKREALDWIVAEEAACLSGERGAGTGAQTLADAIDRYLASSAKLGRSDRTRLVSFKRESIAARPLADLTPEDFSTWRDRRVREVSDGSVIREMTIWRGVLEYARTDLGWIKANPIKGVKRPKDPPPRDRLISAEEIDAMLVALDWEEGRVEKLQHEVACAFLIALETGMRCGEILALRPGNVDGAVATVRKSTTDPENKRRSKNADAREVPLSRRARELFAMLRAKRLHGIRKRGDGRLFHVDEASLDTTFRRARKKAALSGFTFHDSRANALTSLSKKLDVLQLAKMIGHRDPKSLMVYYREPAESIAERLG